MNASIAGVPTSVLLFWIRHYGDRFATSATPGRQLNHQHVTGLEILYIYTELLLPVNKLD